MGQKKLLLGKCHRVKLVASLSCCTAQGPSYNSHIPVLSEESVVEHSLHSESKFTNENDNILRPMTA